MSSSSITIAGGCFWCTEAVFQRLRGVEKVTPGYTGGYVKNPTYEEVCTGKTGHAEATKVEFNTQVISLDDLLNIFWHTHDPTTLNMQGNDVGTQYRSAVFYSDEEQRQTAERVKKEIETSKDYNRPFVTEISPLMEFYPAEGYHTNYYNRNSDQPYCSVVITPKLSKLLKNYSSKVKKDAKI